MGDLEIGRVLGLTSGIVKRAMLVQLYESGISFAELACLFWQAPFGRLSNSVQPFTSWAELN